MYFSKATIIAVSAFIAQGIATPTLIESRNTNITDCAAVRSDCQSSGDPNQAYCASLSAQCCENQDNACRTGEMANMATCSAEKAACYASASLPDPYANNKRADADGEECAAVRSDCQSGPDPNQAFCASQAADCCQKKDNACRTAPDANMSTCSAKKASCFAAASLPDPYSN